MHALLSVDGGPLLDMISGTPNINDVLKKHNMVKMGQYE